MDLSDARILLVDDDPFVLETTERILESAGCSCRSTTDIREALDLLSSADFQLLVTDVSMPQMSGPDLARQGFRLQPDLKVLFVSGGFDGEIRFRWEDPQLDKPYTPDQLLKNIRQVLEGNHTPKSRPPQVGTRSWRGPERRGTRGGAHPSVN